MPVLLHGRTTSVIVSQKWVRVAILYLALQSHHEGCVGAGAHKDVIHILRVGVHAEHGALCACERLRWPERCQAITRLGIPNPHCAVAGPCNHLHVHIHRSYIQEGQKNSMHNDAVELGEGSSCSRLFVLRARAAEECSAIGAYELKHLLGSTIAMSLWLAHPAL